MRPEGPIRLLIIDGSPVFAQALAAELESCGGIHAVSGTGKMLELRQQLLQYHPEVILLDLGLRQVDPLQVLTRLRTYYPVPVIASAEPTAENAVRAVQAIQRGALEVVRRPDSTRSRVLRAYARDLAAKIRTAVALARPVPEPRGLLGSSASFRACGLHPERHVVAIGASTGGTKALETLLSRVPVDFPPIVIVQHMPAAFTESFAARLNSRSAVLVVQAVDGQMLGPGQAVLARGDTHLVVRPAGTGFCVRYTDHRPVNRHCPSADVLFESVAAAAGKRAVGVLLTGMGEDGARGLLKVRQAGGLTIAQDKESCVVYGMPKAAVELGAVMQSAPPEGIPATVIRLLQQRQRTTTQGPAG